MTRLDSKSDSKPPSVLVVDDDPGFLESAVGLLSMEFTVDGCESANAALVMLTQRSYDVVVADWQMPEIDGLTLVTRIQEKHVGISCLLLTGRINEVVPHIDRTLLKTLGVLGKGCSPEKLLNQVRTSAKMATTRRLLRGLS